MNPWKQSAWEAANLLLGKPTSSTELTVLLVVGAALFLILFHLITKLMSLPICNVSMAGATLLILTAASVGAGAAGLIYLSPLEWLHGEAARPWIPFGTLLPALLVVVVPSMRLTHRGRYGQSLVALLLGLGALAATLVLTHAVYGAIKSGDQEFERTRSRTHTVNEFINH